MKNRRKDVLPGNKWIFILLKIINLRTDSHYTCISIVVERTRVKLPPVLGIEGGDYINASYIDVCGHIVVFISPFIHIK